MKLLKIAALFSLFALNAQNVFSQTISPWQIHKNKTIISFATSTMDEGRAAFGKAVIPAQNASGWGTAPLQNGGVYVDEASILKTCKKELHFTYFQTIVNVPANVNVTDFKVSYDVADDAARIYLFNSKNPKGVFDQASDLFFNANNYKPMDLKSLVAPGDNRIVIVQYDNCATKNTIKGIHVKINGTEVKAVVAPPKLPSKFKVHAFSISQGQGDKDPYWFGTNGSSRGQILSQAKLTGGAKWMEIEQIDLGNHIYAFKVLNAGADMYLTARDNKEVHIDKVAGGKISDAAKFKSVAPLTTAKSAITGNFHSFQSVKFSDHYLRHEHFQLFVHPSNGSELFKQDASWQIQKM